MHSYDTYESILTLWAEGVSKTQIARRVGVSLRSVGYCIKKYGNLETLQQARMQFEAGYSNRGFRSEITDEQVCQAVAKASSMREVLIMLGVVPAGGNYKTFKQRIIELGLDTSHFRGKGWRKGKKKPTYKIPLEQILRENSTYQRTTSLRKRLIEEGYFEHRCAECGLTEWRNQPIPLELDHINGERQDNRLENLRLLCPNCHALTSTYRGKNMQLKKPNHKA